MTKSLEAALKLEETKPKMQLVLGADHTESLVKLLQEYANVLTPVRMKSTANLTKAVTSRLRKLKGALAPEVDDNDKFYNTLCTAKVDSIRLARTELIKAVDDFEAKCPSHQQVSEVQEARREIRAARLQTVRCGLLAFMKVDDIRSDQAADIRKNLKSIWELHKEDEEVLEYLGDKIVQQILDIIAIPAPSSAEKGGKRSRGSGGEATAPKAGKRQCKS